MTTNTGYTRSKSPGQAEKLSHHELFSSFFYKDGLKNEKKESNELKPDFTPQLLPTYVLSDMTIPESVKILMLH